MRAKLNFDDIATHKAFEQFKGKRVAIEVISLDKDDVNKLQNKFLYYCYQIAEYLTETHDVKYSVKDAIFINYLKVCKSFQIKTNEDNNIVFIMERKHYLEMNTEELQNLLKETVLYWLPLFDLEL